MLGYKEETSLSHRLITSSVESSKIWHLAADALLLWSFSTCQEDQLQEIKEFIKDRFTTKINALELI